MKKQITLLFILANLFANAQTFTVDIELIQKVVCENLNVGTIKAKPVNISGSFTLFTYKWSNNEVTPTITNLAPATYSVTVTGHRSAPPFTVVKTKSYTLLYEPKISYTQVVIKTCGNEFNGAVDINPSGGVGPYTYSWKNIFVTGVKTGTSMPAKELAPGTFAFTITDNNGCSRVASLTVGKRPQIEVSETISDVKCFGESTGSVKLTISPFGVYQYKWSNGKTTPNLLDVPIGQYKATITAIAGEADGCSISTGNFNVKEPPKLIIDQNIKEINCFGQHGDIYALPYGGKLPFSYLWSTGSTFDRILYKLSGNYSVTVTDANGCKESKNFILADPPEFKVKLNKIDHRNGNSGGNIDVTNINGNTPIAYTWHDANLNIVGTQEDILNQKAGMYSISMWDNKNCAAMDTFEILQLTAIDQKILEKVKAYYSYSDQKVNLKYLENIEIKSMRIYDLQGKQILHFPNPKDVEEIDLSDIPMGLYVLQMETELGQASVKISKVSRE